MFIFILVIALIISIIALIVYGRRIKKVREKYLGKDAVDKIAKEAAGKATHKEGIITCDYCGSRIDTDLYKTCPQCGASYGNDSEWLNRHKVDQKKMNELIDAQLEKNRQNAKRENKDSIAHVRRIMTGLAIAAGVIILLIVLVTVHEHAMLNRSDKMPSGYILSDYSFEDAVIVDNDQIKMELAEVYEMESYIKSYMVAVHITNKADTNLYINFEGAAINNKCLWEWFDAKVGKNKAEIIRYMDIYGSGIDEDHIKTFAVTDVDVRNSIYQEIFSSDDVLKFNTTARIEAPEKEAEGDVIFSRDNVIATVYKDRFGQDIFQVTNNEEHDYEIKADILADDEKERFITSAVIPYGCQYEKEMPDHKENDELLIRMEFEGIDDKRNSFSTEWLSLR